MPFSVCDLPDAKPIRLRATDLPGMMTSHVWLGLRLAKGWTFRQVLGGRWKSFVKRVTSHTMSFNHRIIRYLSAAKIEHHVAG